jgi:hypothetical protein
MTGPKILTFDIETSPHLSWHFDTRNVFVNAIQNVQPSRVICWAAKWHDRNTVMFQSEVESTHMGMLHGIRDLLDQADVVVTYNGNGFDIPRLRWEFQQVGIPQPSPFVSVDLYNVPDREAGPRGLLPALARHERRGRAEGRTGMEGLPSLQQARRGDHRGTVRPARTSDHHHPGHWAVRPRPAQLGDPRLPSLPGGWPAHPAGLQAHQDPALRPVPVSGVLSLVLPDAQRDGWATT